MAARCLGRLVLDAPKGEWMLSFEDGWGQFHVPIRCDRTSRADGLCERCIVRQVRTEQKVAEIGTRTTIGGMLPSYLHGKITDPIPFWSRIYDGAWYRLKLAEGARVSEETMARAKKAVAEAYAGVKGEQPEPEPLPAGGGKRGRKKAVEAEVKAETKEPPAPKPKRKAKTLAEKRAEVAATQEPPRSILSYINAPLEEGKAVVDANPQKEEPPVQTKAKPKQEAKAKAPVASAASKRKPAKKVGAAAAAAAAPTQPPIESPKAVILPGTRADPVDDVQTIRVVLRTLGERQLYYEPQKEKVYDLKFKYLGRWDSKLQRIVSFPDSDAEP